MKTKMLLIAALIGAVSLSAQARVYVGVSFGIPVPRVVVTAPVVAPVVTVAPVVEVAPVVAEAPACPAPGYVWFAGYWSGDGAARVWVPGCWRPCPAHVVYAHPFHQDYGHHYDGRHH
jgi:hypothetical protein